MSTTNTPVTTATTYNPDNQLRYAVVHCDGVYGAGTTADEAIEDSLRWLSGYPTFDSVVERIDDDSDETDLITASDDCFDSYLSSNESFVQVDGNWYVRT